ncbi:MAG: hypothetical protein WKF94_11995 [Solirubrobacteraceae bacterium]
MGLDPLAHRELLAGLASCTRVLSGHFLEAGGELGVDVVAGRI